MKNSGKTNFENAWKEQFEDESFEPDERVWAKIDAYLANHESSVFKKRILFFQLLAAASLIFAVGIGYYNFYLKDTTNSRISLFPSNNNKEEIIKDNLTINHNAIAATNKPNKEGLSPDRNIKYPKKENQIIGFAREADNEIKPVQFSQEPIEESGNFLSLIQNHKELPACEKLYFPGYPGFKSIDNINVELSDIFIQKQQLWAGIDMASGVFNPNITYGARNSMFNFNGKAAASAQVPATSGSGGNSYFDPEKSTYDPQISYSYGVNMGYKIAPKWILNGGFGYQFARSSTTVNKYIESTSLSERYAYGTLGQYIKNADGVMSINTSNSSINLNSDYEFITFPVTAGYVMIDRKIKWTLNGGLATEILLKNTLYDPDNFLSSVEFKPGKDSPYRTTMFSGILGTSVYLPLFKNYRISFFPAYRFGFNYMTKESSSFNSKPTSFMLSAGMAYIFK